MAKTVELSAQVREIINRSNVQLRSLTGLPEGLLRFFQERRREPLLIFKGKPVRAAFLARIDEEIFEVQAPELVPYLKKGAMVLAVFPGNDGRRYVLQTRVASIFAEKIRLACLDPRFSERVKPETEAVVSYRRIPDEMEIAIQDGGLKVFRSLDGQVVEKVAPEKDSRNPPGFDAKRNFAVLADISTGGMGLVSKTMVDPQIVDHLLYVENEDTASCRIGLFGVVRSVREENGGGRIHLMFVARIPEEIVKKVTGK